MDQKELFIRSPLPWWEWNVAENTVDFNDLKATMIGYDPKELKGKGYAAFTDLLHPDDYSRTMEAMQRVLDRETNLYQTDYRILASNGEYHWYMDRGIVLDKTGDNRVIRLRGLVIDLSREYTQELKISQLVALLNKTVPKSRDEAGSLLTLCSSCRKAKVTQKEWITINSHLEELLGESISHGICPTCLQSLYPDIADAVMEQFRP